MKKIKRVVVVLLAVCMCFGTVSHAYAMSTSMPISSSIAECNIGGDDVVLPISDQYPVEDNYNQIWLDKGTYFGKTFRVHNTNKGKIGFTFEVESSSNSSSATIFVTNPKGITILTPAAMITPLTPKDQRELTYDYGEVGYYTIHCDAHAAAGMRINCWTYKWYD